MASNSPDREYALSSLGFMGAYTLAICVATWWTSLSHWPLLAVALTPSIAIAGQLWATLRLMSRVDEFRRAVMAKRFIIAATLAFIAATAWGFLETVAKAPHLPAWLVYPAFWAAFGVVSPFVRTSR